MCEAVVEIMDGWMDGFHEIDHEELKILNSPVPKQSTTCATPPPPPPPPPPPKQ